MASPPAASHGPLSTPSKFRDLNQEHNVENSSADENYHKNFSKNSKYSGEDLGIIPVQKMRISEDENNLKMRISEEEHNQKMRISEVEKSQKMRISEDENKENSSEYDDDPCISEDDNNQENSSEDEDEDDPYPYMYYAEDLVGDLLDDLDYQLTVSDLVTAVKAGLESAEFIDLVTYAAQELGELANLENRLLETEVTSQAWSIELFSLLRELGCPHRILTQGAMTVTERLASFGSRLMLLYFLLTELMAARMIHYTQCKI